MEKEQLKDGIFLHMYIDLSQRKVIKMKKLNDFIK